MPTLSLGDKMGNRIIENLVNRLSSDPKIHKIYKGVFLASDVNKDFIAKEYLEDNFPEVYEALTELAQKNSSSVYSELPFYTYLGQVFKSVTRGTELMDVYKEYEPLVEFKRRVTGAYRRKG